MAVVVADGVAIYRSAGERLSLQVPLRALWVVALLWTILLVVLLASLVLGSYDTGIGMVFAVLTGQDTNPASQQIIWDFRIPRALVAALVGAMMALSGSALQNVTRNGLADPSLVGISQGAALAVVAGIVLLPDLSYTWRPALAFGGALAIAAAVQILSRRQRGNNTIRFILIGIGVAALVSAITSAFLTYGQLDRAMSALAWLAGSINAARWTDVWVLGLWCAMLLPVLLGLSRTLAVLRMGEATAVGLGARVRAARLLVLAVSVALAAAATATVGPLGFVGLVAPHAARRMAHAGPAMNLVMTALTGAILVAAADLIGRALFAPVQIPAGLVTAVIGVPIFVLLLRRANAAQSL